MRAHVGTSGFSHPDWRGAFYPSELKDSHLLGWYALRLRSVELGTTFYGLPRGDQLQQWSSATPTDFVFTLKAWRRITHKAKLDDAGEHVRTMYSRVQLLGHKLGPVLFQCPASLRKDVGLLDAFLETLPQGARAAVEFRSRSWYDDDVLAVLERRGVALSEVDWDDPAKRAPRVATGRFGYVRLRGASYSDEALELCAEDLLSRPWDEVFLFFSHEEDGAAPKLALRMLEHVEAAQPLRPLRKTEPRVAPALKPLARAVGGPARREHGDAGG